MQAIWGSPHKFEYSLTQRSLDKVESVLQEQLGPEEQELMQQTRIGVDPDYGACLGAVSTYPDEAFGPMGAQELPLYFQKLNAKRDGMLTW